MLLATLPAYVAYLVLTARPLPELTGREHEVRAELLHGRGTGDVACRLALSDKTVRNYVSDILTKLGVRDRTQLVVKAREADYPIGPSRLARGS